MQFSLENSLPILEQTPAVLRTFFAQLPEAWVNTNEGENTWSVFDVVGHLIHGEHTDWIPRTKLILSNNEVKTFIPFDRFAQFQDSRGKTLTQLLSTFKLLRHQNIISLKSFSISDTDLSKTGIHPEFGTVTLKQLLATWVAHDLGHIAQISRVMAKQYKEEAGPWTQYLKILQS